MENSAFIRAHDRVRQNNRIHSKSIAHFFVSVLIYAFIVIGLIQNNDNFINFAVVCSCIYILISNVSNSLLFLLGLTIFENSFKIAGLLGWFFVVAVFVAKNVFVKSNFKQNGLYKSLIATVLLCSVSFFTDAISYGLEGQIITTIILIVFFGVIFNLNDSKLSLSSGKMCIYIGASFICAIIYLLNQYGGLADFIKLFMNSPYAYRFGHSYGEIVGGSMGIPIYALMVISFSLVAFLEERNQNIIQIIIMIVLDLVSIVFGALTISRSFYVGISIILVLFIFGRSKGPKILLKKIAIIALVCLLFFAVSKAYGSVVNQVFNNLFTRISADETSGGTGARVEIWNSCFKYLFDNPYGFIFGFGSNGYPQIGYANDLLFFAGAHNIFVDVLMSWGVIGFSLVLSIIHRYHPKNGYFELLKNKTIYLVPLITLIVFSMTAMRTNSFKTFIYLYCCFYIINSFDSEREKEGGLR